MRVLHVMEATIGGTQRHITDVARGQRDQGLEVHLVVSAERQPAFREELDRLRGAGVGVVELPMVRAVRPLLDWRHGRRIRSRIRELRPEVVHTHSSKAGVLGRRAALAEGVPAVVHTPHTFSFLFQAEFGALKRRLFRAIEARLARRTGAVIAVSATEGETFRRSGVVPPERIRVVPNGIDPAPWEAASPAERRALGVPEGVPVALVAGLLHVAKGQDLALRALARCARADLHLLIAGEGGMRAELEQLARSLGIADRAHFLGFRRDVPSLMAAADFLLLPSRWEGMPYVVMEAMAAGRAVLASRVDGAVDLVRDGESGLLVGVDSVEELGAALDRMAGMDERERARMGAAGRARLRGSFTATEMVRGLIEVYREVS